jgi:ribose/xylose/arabinose/galactoside ABC-type transport system permease subunit
MKRDPSFWWLLLGLLALVGYNVAANPAFLKVTLLEGHLYGVPIDIFTQGSRTMLVALGMTLVIATGGVDLSVGSVAAIAAAVSALMLQAGHGVAATVAAAAGVGALAGAFNGLLVARLAIQPIVATLILMVAGRGIALELCGGQVLIFQNRAFNYLATGFVGGLPVAPLLVAVLFVATHFFVRRSAVGLFIEAAGDNATASRFAGLATARVTALTYVFCGVCAALTGVLFAANVGVADANHTGEDAELDAIFAVVVGGTALTGGRFTIGGTFLGAVLIQTLAQTMYYRGVAPAVAPVPKALLIIAVSLLQSEKLRRAVGRLMSRERKAAA